MSLLPNIIYKHLRLSIQLLQIQLLHSALFKCSFTPILRSRLRKFILRNYYYQIFSTQFIIVSLYYYVIGFCICYPRFTTVIVIINLPRQIDISRRGKQIGTWHISIWNWILPMIDCFLFSVDLFVSLTLKIDMNLKKWI